MKAEIVAFGKYLPREVLDNKFFTDRNPYKIYKGRDENGNPIYARENDDSTKVKFLTEEDILGNTGGIKERRRAASCETVESFVENAFRQMNFPAENLTGILVATVSYDNGATFPSAACRIQEFLNARNVRYTADFVNNESGFDYALDHARLMAKEGGKNYLIVGVEQLDKIKSFSKINQNLFDETKLILISSSSTEQVRQSQLFPDNLEGILVGTTRQRVSSVAYNIKELIGAKNVRYAADVVAACSGFTHALDFARLKIKEEGGYWLVAGVDLLTRLADEKEINYNLFGDGCGAVIVRRTSNDWGGILATTFDSQIDGIDYIFKDKLGKLRMPQGPKVFAKATRGMIDISHKLIEKAGIKKEDIKLYIPHQANGRILDYIEEKEDPERQGKIFRNIEKYGNMSSATVPVALCEAVEQERVKKGDLVILADVGSGLALGGALIRI